MRTIKFKAKRVDTGEWVVGFYYNAKATVCIEGFHSEPHKVDTHYILQFETPDTAGWEMEMQTDFIEIDPETVCQFTGLLDKNGTEIYERDVVRFFTQSQGAEGVDSSGFYDRDVVWECLWWNIEGDYLENGESGFAVVGNAHDILKTP